jgi:hypothetical protein
VWYQQTTRRCNEAREVNALDSLNEEFYTIMSVVSYYRQKMEMNGSLEMNMSRVLQLNVLKRVLCTARYEYRRNTNERLSQWRNRV